MAVRSRLVDVSTPTDPQGVALVLHGGAARRGAAPVSPAQLSVLRMVPVADRLARAGRHRLAVLRLLNSTRGWDAQHTPVDDVRWALDEVRARFGTQVPVALVGHSLGGRAAVLSAVDPQVTSVVALAGWFDGQERLPALPGRQVLFVHGDHDRIASLPRALAVARSLSGSADVGFVTVPGGKHAMLSHSREFGRATGDWVTATLLGDRVDGVVGRVLAGERGLDA